MKFGPCNTLLTHEGKLPYTRAYDSRRFLVGLGRRREDDGVVTCRDNIYEVEYVEIDPTDWVS